MVAVAVPSFPPGHETNVETADAVETLFGTVTFTVRVHPFAFVTKQL
jgi:hypothetical protein